MTIIDELLETSSRTLEEKEEVANHRENFLNVLSYVSGKHGVINMCDHIEITATILNFDVCLNHVIVKEATTFMGKTDHIILRMSDVLSLTI